MRLQGPLFFLLFALLYNGKSVAFDLQGSTVGCQGPVADFKLVTMNSKVLLNKKFLDQHNDTTVRAAIELQLKHLMGYFNNTSKAGLNVALSAYREAPDIIKIEKVKYGYQLEIDNYLRNQGYYKYAVDAYIDKALKRGYADSDDEALLISYKTKVLVADCSDKSFSPNTEVELPLDPFLSVWLEAPSKRKLREFNGHKLLASSCFIDEIADFGQAGISWFFWSPATTKRNTKDMFLTCKVAADQIVKPRFEITRTLDKVTPPQKTFFSSETPLVLSAIFGVVTWGDPFSKVNFESAQEMASRMLTHCQKAENVPTCLSIWRPAFRPQKDGKLLEFGAFSFFEYLRYLMTVVKPESVSTERNSADIQVKIAGVFRDSGKPVSVTVYYGKTSLNSSTPVPETYFKFLHTSLKNADSLSYFGHAGLGMNLDFAALSEAFKKRSYPNFRRTKNLWLGVYNCEGFSYFGFDLNPIFSPGQKLLLTQTSGIEVDAKFPMAQIEVMSRLFSDKTTHTFSILSQYVRTKDFLTETMFTYR